MKFAVVVFPGSNCDHDAYHAAKHVLRQNAELIWHKDTDLAGADAVILPGGFAHGDYLRTGAIARFSPIMAARARLPAPGGPPARILPGGFAPGACLRPGPLARFSPIMAAVRRFAEQGGPVLGICNGFQIL